MTFSATSSVHPPSWRFVPGAEAVALERWDAEFNVGSLHVGASWITLADLGAEVGEGLRAGRVRGPEPLLYRPSHIGDGVLVPDAAYLEVPPTRSSRSIGPGDVLVSKFLPPRAALVSPGMPRHAPDGNCLRVIGLRQEVALWITGLLSHPGFAPRIAQHGSGRSLPRIGARELAELPFPAPPAGLATLATAWSEAGDERLEIDRDLIELQAETQEFANDKAPAAPDPRKPTWVPPENVPDTWAPDQAALVRYQHQLARAGWVKLGRFLAKEPARLRGRIPPARLLRLTDATGDLGFKLPDVAPVRPPWFRIYADPLRPGEVLLSTLGSAPKVVLSAPPTVSTVWVSDQWARLDGGAAPGALALGLRTSQVIWQLGSAATGAVRQFIGRGELAEVCVPAPTAGIAASINRRLLDLMERRKAIDDRLAGLRAELAALVAASLEVPA